MLTQEERRIALIHALLEEMPEYGELSIPEDTAGQARLLRSLMNLRPPLPASPSFLSLQDAYLAEEVKRRGVVDAGNLPPVKEGSRMVLWQGDITRLKADAIVNAANSALLGCFQPCHSCIDNVIHTRAGVQLRLACHALMRAQGYEEPAGTAKITAAYNLPCGSVLHTVGPVVSGPLTERDCALLASCYEACLRLGVKHGVKSIAFCCISTGVFRFPPDRAARIAVETVARFLEKDSCLERVVFDVYTQRDLRLYQNLLQP